MGWGNYNGQYWICSISLDDVYKVLCRTCKDNYLIGYRWGWWQTSSQMPPHHVGDLRCDACNVVVKTAADDPEPVCGGLL